MMRISDAIDLILLAALWGASFLFMRVGTPEFGPLAFVFVRVAGAAALLLPLLAWRRQTGALRAHWRPILVVGVCNTALPFLGFALAALVLSAGLSGVFNATAPLWSAVVAWLWLGERPAAARTAGLVVGFAGVVALAASRSGLAAGDHGVSPLVGTAGCLGATLLYGFSANYTRRRLAGVPPLAVAAGSQLAAAVVMAVPALLAWPAVTPSPKAWAAAVVIATLCTGLAYILYFRLIAHVGATQAIAVTYLIPAFAMLWGALVLAEPVTPAMLAGCATVLLGTAMASGLVGGKVGAGG